MTLAAIDPTHNAIVHAAAGTGKTWLLVSRIVRLLLDGAKPSSILAITFTRKAAAEMRLRMGERLLAMCEAPEATLRAMLQEIGATPDPATAERARQLYEELLVAPHELRATTFHAFCQELLTRFAFEADVPPAFRIIEQTAEQEALAWRALDRDLAADGEIGAAMERLLHAAGGLDNVRRALQEFLAHRSDWWAYTESETDPVAYAVRRLQQTLEIDPALDPLDALASDAANRQLIEALAHGIGRDTPASLQIMHAALLQAAATHEAQEHYRLLCEALYTKSTKTPRVFKPTKALLVAIGADRAQTLVRQHAVLLDRVEAATEQRRRHATWRRARDWYVLGARLLEHFQAVKRAEGALDFADLEWLTYRLLSGSRHAEWVQYKLDQRIDHLLVDEFQDTNPTQWRLLLPLLQEMAAGPGERRRSAFLVGDEKQSIYRFRRAEPELFAIARDWLVERAGARAYEQHVSWRSSPAVMRFVNLVFDGAAADPGDSDHALPNFRAHETHRDELWGHAELLPLILSDPGQDASPAFRDPLAEPRRTEEDRRREREGRMIAEKIQSLLGRPIRHKDEIRPLRYGDIMILVRARTHTAWYEAALRRAAIPYAGAGRGSFTGCLEVRDLLSLLRLLVSPWENVALATVLRSPLFAATEDELLALAGADGANWFERLLGQAWPGSAALARAAQLLPAWRAMADRVPVHDLLDRIYFEANVPQRYRAAAPAHLRLRVSANLTRLLDLALEADGGRFPSLARFLARLDILTQEDSESLDAGAGDAGDQVRLLTIHAAKGLESPVVFLVDAARETNGRDPAIEALVEWPVASARPTDFLLSAGRSEADGYTRALLERRRKAAFQEESNLLYVALTRAQQFLFVSGCEPARRKRRRAGDTARGWYGYIERRLESARASGAAARQELHLQTVDDGDGQCINIHGFVSHGLAPVVTPEAVPAGVTAPVDPALTRPFETRAATPSSAPELDDDPSPEADVTAVSAAKRRGIVIHRMLERLTADGGGRAHLRRQLSREFGAVLDEAQLDAYWKEACAVIDAPQLRRFFDSAAGGRARNEVAVIYRDGNRDVTGIIDRLLIGEDRLVLIDYKTHATTPDRLPALVAHYTPQLRLYAEGLRRLWPGRHIEAVLLFTHSRQCVTVDLG